VTIGTFYAPKIFNFMMNISSEYGIAVKEVETAFLRKGIQSMGFKCDHIRMGIRKTDHKPYCKDCWQIFRQIKAPRYNSQTKELVEPGQYIPEPTFLDKDKEIDETPIKLQGPSPKFRGRFKTETVPTGMSL
jgi:hypothetical protein